MDKTGLGWAIGKGAVGSIPYVGNLLAELLGYVQSSMGEKKFKNWTEEIERRFDSIIPVIEKLQDSELFDTCIRVATEAAAKAYQDEKRRLLANALANCAINNDLADDKELFFLELIDRYTLTAIKILAYLSQGINIEVIPIARQIQTAMPEFEGDSDYCVGIVQRLETDRLINSVYQGNRYPSSNVKTTALGDEFLTFLKDDPQEQLLI